MSECSHYFRCSEQNCCCTAAALWRTFVDGCCSRFRSGSRDASSRLSGPGDVDVTCAFTVDVSSLHCHVSATSGLRRRLSGRGQYKQLTLQLLVVVQQQCSCDKARLEQVAVGSGGQACAVATHAAVKLVEDAVVLVQITQLQASVVGGQQSGWDWFGICNQSKLGKARTADCK